MSAKLCCMFVRRKRQFCSLAADYQVLNSCYLVTRNGRRGRHRVTLTEQTAVSFMQGSLQALEVAVPVTLVPLGSCCSSAKAQG